MTRALVPKMQLGAYGRIMCRLQLRRWSALVPAAFVGALLFGSTFDGVASGAIG